MANEGEKPQEGNNTQSGNSENTQIDYSKLDYSKLDVSKLDVSKIDPSKLDFSKFDATKIPETVIKATPAHQKLLNESIDRRKKNSELTKQLKAVNKGEDEADDEPVVDPKKPNQSEDGMPDWFKPFAEKLSKLDETNLDQWRTNAGKATGIKSVSLLASLQGKTEAEVLSQAKKIASEQGIEPPKDEPHQRIGNPTGQRDKSIMERANCIMQGDSSQDIFSVEAQKAMGGGILYSN